MSAAETRDDGLKEKEGENLTLSERLDEQKQYSSNFELGE